MCNYNRHSNSVSIDPGLRVTVSRISFSAWGAYDTDHRGPLQLILHLENALYSIGLSRIPRDCLVEFSYNSWEYVFSNAFGQPALDLSCRAHVQAIQSSTK